MSISPIVRVEGTRSDHSFSISLNVQVVHFMAQHPWQFTPYAEYADTMIQHCPRFQVEQYSSSLQGWKQIRKGSWHPLWG